MIALTFERSPSVQSMGHNRAPRCAGSERAEWARGNPAQIGSQHHNPPPSPTDKQVDFIRVIPAVYLPPQNPFDLPKPAFIENDGISSTKSVCIPAVHMEPTRALVSFQGKSSKPGPIPKRKPPWRRVRKSGLATWRAPKTSHFAPIRRFEPRSLPVWPAQRGGPPQGPQTDLRPAAPRF